MSPTGITTTTFSSPNVRSRPSIAPLPTSSSSISHNTSPTDGFILPTNRWDSVLLDDLMLKHPTKWQQKKQLERAGYLGYAPSSPTKPIKSQLTNISPSINIATTPSPKPASATARKSPSAPKPSPRTTGANSSRAPTCPSSCATRVKRMR